MTAIQAPPVDRLAKMGIRTLLVDHFATPQFPTLVAYRLALVGFLALLAAHCAIARFPTLAAGCLVVVFLTLAAHHLATVRFPMFVTDHCPSVVQTVEKDPTTPHLKFPASLTQVSHH